MPRINKLLGKDQISTPLNRCRFKLICFGVLLLPIILLFRVADLQLIDHPILERAADDRSMRVKLIVSNRGSLLDRNGQTLALSVPSKDIVADPVKLLKSEPDFHKAKWHYLAAALAMRIEDLAALIIHNKDKHFLYLRRKVEEGVAKDIAELHLNGISSLDNDSRFYPMAEEAAPLIGIVGDNNKGLNGIEKSFNGILQGLPGREKIRQDRHGQIISVLEYNPPIQPVNIQLSIDKFIQHILYTQLSAAVVANKADSGAAVMIRIDTGEILGLASYPSFNPNNYQAVTAVQMRNMAINDSFEPGSTVKPLVIMAGLARKLVKPDTVLETKPYRVNGHLIRDVGHWARLSMTGILQKSSDIGVSHIALAMPADALVNAYHDFGLGKSTGLGLVGESIGYFPTHRQRWADIDRATFSFGYGLRVTPLQIAQEYATLGSFGILRPLSITKVTPPVEGKRVADADVVRRVIHMMESDALPGGSGVRAAVSGYRLAIKTGTAEKIGSKGKYDGGYINYTAGVAPASHPVIALVVVINHPTAGDHFGGTVAAPVFGQIMGPILTYLNIAPDALLLASGADKKSSN